MQIWRDIIFLSLWLIYFTKNNVQLELQEAKHSIVIWFMANSLVHALVSNYLATVKPSNADRWYVLSHFSVSMVTLLLGTRSSSKYYIHIWLIGYDLPKSKCLSTCWSRFGTVSRHNWRALQCDACSGLDWPAVVNSTWLAIAQIKSGCNWTCKLSFWLIDLFWRCNNVTKWHSRAEYASFNQSGASILHHVIWLYVITQPSYTSHEVTNRPYHS